VLNLGQPGTSDLKAGVSNMDTDFSLYETPRGNALRILKIFFFINTFAKIRAYNNFGKNWQNSPYISI
jgi:hypothetical protein